MKRKLLIPIILILIFPAFSSSQILKKLGDKVKNKTDRKVEQKVDKTIDNVFKKNTEAEKSIQKNSTVTEKVDAPDTTESTTAYKSKFDFIPGEKVIYGEDFSEDEVGDFPAKWNTNGSGEIVTIDNMVGRWLMLKASSNFSFNDLLKLPENFTLQFDLVCSVPFTWNSGSIFLGIADIKNPETYLNTRSHNLNSNDNIVFWLDMRPTDSKKKAKGYGHYNLYNTSDTKMVSANLEMPWFADTKENHLLKVSVWKQKQRLRIYLNENKIIDLPRILPPGMNVNTLVFKTESLSGNDKYFISNLRIAIGNPDKRNKLITEGKWITNGILFDFNSDRIKPESYGVLKEVAGVLQENKDLSVKIIGHTDSDGDETKNLELSKRRAMSVKNILVSEFNIDTKRMETDGKGESEPLSPNTTAVNKANNRRVEFIKIHK